MEVSDARKRNAETASSGSAQGSWQQSVPVPSGALTEADASELKKAFERDVWANEWNSLPTATERILAEREASLRAQIAADIEAAADAEVEVSQISGVKVTPARYDGILYAARIVRGDS